MEENTNLQLELYSTMNLPRAKKNPERVSELITDKLTTSLGFSFSEFNTTTIIIP